MQVIKPNVAGAFYSADRRELSDAVHQYIDKVSNEAISSRVKALIVPHAGYVYSGPVAGSAYAALTNQASTIQRVVLLAPSHYYGFEGLATTSADVLETPLGEVKVDREAIAKIEAIPGVIIANEAFNNEHALEVQLPFLQTVLSDFKVIPFIVRHHRNRRSRRGPGRNAPPGARPEPPPSRAVRPRRRAAASPTSPAPAPPCCRCGRGRARPRPRPA